MKNILSPLLIAVLFIASCKKETDDLTNNPPDTRTGLELLTDENAENYCVLIVASGSRRDTVVWQNTAGDHTTLTSGKGMMGVGNYIYHMGSQYFPADTVKFTTLQLRFQKKIPSLQGNYTCPFSDSVIRKGEVPFNQDNVYILLKDQTNIDMSNLFIDSPNGKLEILSVTKVPVIGGCEKLRVKAKFSEIQFGEYQCFVPAYVIKEGLVQMDYQMQ